MIRPVWVEVDLSKIKHNVKSIKAMLSSGTEFMAVVKANGYGHGSLEVAKAALESGATRLGVALVEEAIPLREAGISSSIHLLTGPPPGSASKIAELDLIPAVFTEAHLEELKSNKISVHVKVDTGMNRIGLKPERLDSFMSLLKNYPDIKAEGLFTHFATSDDPKSDLFKRQLDIANSLYEKYKNDFQMIHVANSAATLFNKATHFDMVRIGIAMYGLRPSCVQEISVELKPALSWLAKVTHVKTISKGESVSYGARYTASGESSIATVPVGYADGYSRSLSGQSYVIAKGKKMPQVGTICMDQFLFLNKNNSIKVNDKIVLIGTEEDSSFAADDIAEILKTINYEVVCAISNRVPRVYVESGKKRPS